MTTDVVRPPSLRWTMNSARNPYFSAAFSRSIFLVVRGVRALGVAGVGLAAATPLAGCGHKATAADCQLIVDRNVEVEMKKLNITDPTAIAKRKDEEKNDPKTKSDLNGCIGKRITDAMMSCVVNAQTGDEIDQCIR